MKVSKGKTKANVINQVLDTVKAAKATWKRKEKQRNLNFKDIIEQKRKEAKNYLEKNLIKIL